MTFTHALSQIPAEKQALKELKKIIFGKNVTCPPLTKMLIYDKIWY